MSVVPFLKNRSSRGKWLKILSCLFLLLAAPALGQGSPEYDGNDGPYAVKFIKEINIQDAGRNRTIPLKIYFPKSSGTFPVILYSHGLGGSKEGKRYLGLYWASHGYIGIFMTHLGSDTSLIDRDKPLEESTRVLRQSVRNPKNLVNRPKDVTTVINSLSKIADLAPELRGKMDPERIGVAGHSFGAFTVMVSAGAWAETAKQVFKAILKDERPRAYLAMSPQAVREGLDPKVVFSGISRPMMTMTGTNDTDPIGRGMTGEARLQPYRNMPPGDKYSLWIEGAFHWTFGDGRRELVPDPKHHQYIKIASLAFWDAYLKDSKEALNLLKSRIVDKMSEGRARLDFK
ncbi:MAG: acetylxylan esterase [Deltaproteobacteria bacterium]|nr:acetylxylan esterase [Deltaproteobacteria bacterium]